MTITQTKEEQMRTDWWCPEEQRFVDCPGPCNDGRTHVKRSRYVTMAVVRGDNPEEVKNYWLNRNRRPYTRGCRS